MPEAATANAVARTLKAIGAAAGAVIGLVSVLTFFFAPLQADVASLKAGMASTNAKIEQLTLKQLTLEADIEGHIQVGHENTKARLNEVSDQLIVLQGEVERAESDISIFLNRQQVVIDQFADLKALVNNTRR